MNGDAVVVSELSKRFRFPAIPKQATLKDLFVRRIRTEGESSVVDALDNVSFSLGHGQTLGVIGRNGSGKTTLLRALAGIITPDQGTISIQGSVAPLLALGIGFHPDLSGRENALIELLTLGIGRSQARRLLDDVIEFSELAEFIEAPMRTYSTGMTMRLAFSAAVCVDPDVLLIDEVLAVGDEAFMQKCIGCIQDFKHRGKTTVLVTHQLGDVEAFCDVALWLDSGHVAKFGSPSEVVTAYHQAFAAAASA